MTITELKASAYDTLAQIEALQMKLRQINQDIADELKKEIKNDADNNTN